MIARIANHLYYGFTVYIVFICLCVVTGALTFGHGLGDMYYLIGVGLAFILISIMKFADKSNIAGLFIVIAIILISVSVGLKLTIWRGVEYSWDGHIFIL